LRPNPKKTIRSLGDSLDGVLGVIFAGLPETRTEGNGVVESIGRKDRAEKPEPKKILWRGGKFHRE
jgi:hypothetical protein